MTSVRVVIFAKAPLAGSAKTRLIPALGLDGSADLARRLLEHTLAQALQAQVGPVELCVTPDSQHPIWSQLPVPRAVSLTEQGEGDLGARMAAAARRVIEAGESLLLLGTDCPQLDALHLQKAAAALSDHDICLTPVSDGGYALLGLRVFDGALFEDIPWSTDKVAQLTLDVADAAGLSVRRFAPLHDIDEPGDLQWLPDGWLVHV